MVKEIITGNYTYKVGDDVSKIKEISGNLIIPSGCNVKFPVLTSNGGGIYIKENARGLFPTLTSNGGGICIKTNARGSFPTLTSNGGHIYIYENARVSSPTLTSNGGDIYIKENARVSFPVLTSNGGHIYIKENARGSFPALTSNGGYIYIYENARGLFPTLTSNGGDIYIGGNARGSFPSNLIKNDVNNNSKQITREINFNAFLELGLLFADGILAKIINTKKNNDYTIYKIQICGKTETSYCVQLKNDFAHGETLKQAYEDLEFKNIDRTEEKKKYAKLTLESVNDLKYWMFCYRIITGACREGTKNFMSQNNDKLHEKMTLADVIKVTQGQYQSDTFKEFFKGE